ncbi:hypothetical protein [Nostoc sp. MS1]|uniref:hypothetical protein n=1 Tax=Nostoc sp. MS1 TaxID=2764711 RepID=UPI001CC43BE0|nr:hypothetical protein [Nostoc sp. MS1]BCL35409.1 hypothetical protein NSMS1_18560 [Nostoc sp. MS1]
MLGKDYILCAIASDFEKEWSISSRDKVHQTTAITYAFLRRPKAIIIYKPGATPQELLDSHLELRQKMIRNLNIELLPLTSLEDYFEGSRKYRIEQKQRLWRKSIIFGMVEMWLFSLKSPEQKYQWFGDYARLARKQ